MPCGGAVTSCRLVYSRGVCSRASGAAPLSLGAPEGTVAKAHNTKLSLKDIPGPSPSLPLIGTGWQYFPGSRYSLSNLHEACADKFRRYGPVVREEFQWGQPVVHLYNPNDFKTVFQFQGPKPLRPISEFLKHYRLRNPDKYDTPGLANTVGDEWLRLRSVLGPVLLQLKSVEGLLGTMNNICDDFVDLLRSERNPHNHLIKNIQEIVYRLSLESIYMMSLESRLGCLERDLQPNTSAFAMISSVKLLFEAFQELFFGLPLWRFYPTKSYRKLDKAESTMYDATNKRIQEAIEKLRENDSSKSDSIKPSILQTLLKTKGLTDKEITVTVIDFISGGIFTFRPLLLDCEAMIMTELTDIKMKPDQCRVQTKLSINYETVNLPFEVTNAFSFLLYHIARNPQVQEKLYQELQRVAPDGEITSKRMEKLSYLKGCVKESFRLTPTIPCIARILPVDITASGYHIPAGTPLFCNFMVACKQPEIFPDPESYCPDRWLDTDQENRTARSYASLPFGHGIRMCVGRRFAEMEMYTALAKVVHNFRLESTGEEVRCKQAFIVVPSHPVSLILRDR